MAFRFRRSIKIAPGLHINLGKKGVSLSAGVRGASMTAGRRGLYGNIGIPGTGLSSRNKIGSPTSSNNYSERNNTPFSSDTTLKVTLTLNDDGTVDMSGEDGEALPPKYVKKVREQNGDYLQSWLNENCSKLNKGIDEILNIHLNTPPEDFTVIYNYTNFEPQQPLKPVQKSAGFWGKVFKSKQQKIDAENIRATEQYMTELQSWKNEKIEHESRENTRRDLIETKRFEAPDGMQDFLSEVLSDLEWPRETSISFSISTLGHEAFLDIDLPEIEDMPTEQVSVAARGLKLNIKKRTETQRRKEYMSHVHAILFRLTGETFVALPSIKTVVSSGFSQRPNKQTGQISDEYLLSVKISRDQWSQLNFSNLETLDLPECFELFDLRREMTKTGVFSPINPFGED